MKRLFYAAALLLVMFEIANVYLLMPLPYSQRVRSIDLAFFLHSWRWLFRALLGLSIVVALPAASRVRSWRKLAVVLMLGGVGASAYATNIGMSADHLFLPPSSVTLAPAGLNQVEPNRLVVGINFGGQARAYPVRFLGYHHQVRDTVAGQPIMVTFCTVCRTGRVFSPVVAGKTETFRLVGMDHYNAMFEDRTTGSWWRQATGEAIAGPRTGLTLQELPSRQVTLAGWLALFPASLIMQADSTMLDQYSTSFDFETGASQSALTGTDTASWHEKSWVVGISSNGASRAYDWNRLRRERVVNDSLGGVPIVLALSADGSSFFAFERPAPAIRFSVRQDSLVAVSEAYDFNGHGSSATLRPIFASQEFWHSWRTFQPATTRY